MLKVIFLGLSQCSPCSSSHKESDMDPAAAGDASSAALPQILSPGKAGSPPSS